MNTSTGINRNKTFMLTLAALFAAVLTAASWISLPLPFTPVPVNLATLAVTLAGALLGHKYGTLSVLVYILLGAAGVPVFAGFTGGLGHLAGPTGGYIIGYLTSAFICGLIMHMFYIDDHSVSAISQTDTGFSDAQNTGRTAIQQKKDGRWFIIAIAALLGTTSCYLIGTAWFMALTGNSLAASLTMCVIPFLPGDALKIAASVFIVSALRPILAKMSL